MQLGPIVTQITDDLIDPRTRWGTAYRLAVWPVVFPLFVSGASLCWLAYFIAYGESRWPWEY